jgi:hypothetical protein
MSKYLKLFAKAIRMRNSVERSRYELERIQELVAEEQGRKMGSTSKGSSEEEEASKTESKTE